MRMLELQNVKYISFLHYIHQPIRISDLRFSNIPPLMRLSLLTNFPPQRLFFVKISCRFLKQNNISYKCELIRLKQSFASYEDSKVSERAENIKFL